MLDQLARFNQKRWDELAQSNVPYSRPMLDLDADSARDFVDPEGILGDVRNKKVLCLAGGGGQQTAAFGLLGAEVAVLDLTLTQLDRDRQAAQHYGLQIQTCQGDMRDLSRFAADHFDIVHHAHSINFIPEPRVVFAQVARVVKNGGYYRFSFHSPFSHGIEDSVWDGGYRLVQPYRDGEVHYDDNRWEVEDHDGSVKWIEGPREFRHTMRTLVAGLVGNGFVILSLTEETSDETDPEPGSWEHFKSIAAPYLTICTTYLPHILSRYVQRSPS